MDLLRAGQEKLQCKSYQVDIQGIRGHWAFSASYFPTACFTQEGPGVQHWGKTSRDVFIAENY